MKPDLRTSQTSQSTSQNSQWYKKLLKEPLQSLAKKQIQTVLRYGRFFFNKSTTNYGHPERFFFENSKLFGLDGQIGSNILGAFSDLLAPILLLSVPCPCFPSINPYFSKSLYIQIPKIYLGLEMEFKAAKYKGFSHRVSVILKINISI
jgi:hypothetical protein